MSLAMAMGRAGRENDDKDEASDGRGTRGSVSRLFSFMGGKDEKVVWLFVFPLSRYNSIKKPGLISREHPSTE